MHRQGDVILTRVDELPEGARLVPHGPDGVVLAEGEVTGHAHRLAGRVRLWSVTEQRYVELPPDPNAVRVWEAAGERYYEVLRPVTESHEEHAMHVIEPGYHHLGIQRVYTLGGDVRRVVD